MTYFLFFVFPCPFSPKIRIPSSYPRTLIPFVYPGILIPSFYPSPLLNQVSNLFETFCSLAVAAVDHLDFVLGSSCRLSDQHHLWVTIDNCNSAPHPSFEECSIGIRYHCLILYKVQFKSLALSQFRIFLFQLPIESAHRNSVKVLT